MADNRRQRMLRLRLRNRITAIRANRAKLAAKLKAKPDDRRAKNWLARIKEYDDSLGVETPAPTPGDVAIPVPTSHTKIKGE